MPRSYLLKVVFYSDLLEGITPDIPQQVKVMLGPIEREKNVLQGPCLRLQSGAYIWQKSRKTSSSYVTTASS